MISLVNFNVPAPLKHRFDRICRAAGRTRTSVLIDLMEAYVISQSRVLASKSAEFDQIDQLLEKSGLTTDLRPIRPGLPDPDDWVLEAGSKSIFEAILPPRDDGFEPWQ